MSALNIEDIYPLSPMQQGMAFHSLLEPESGVYVDGTICRVQGNLDVDAFQRAWQVLIEQHAILRTALAGSGVEALDDPFQIVYKSAELPFEVQDWREFSADEQEKRLAAYVAETQRRGFDLATPPLMRIALLRIADDAHYLVWASHHLLFDGWSGPLLIADLLQAYEAPRLGEAPAIKRRPPYRNYIAWLKQQDMAEAERFWREALAGFTAPTPLPGDRFNAATSRDEPAYDHQRVLLSAETSATLYWLARELRVTLSTVVQGAWAVLLSRYSGEQDVVFGSVVSGRPPELPGVEDMVGLFVNTLPLRVQVTGEQPVAEWLQTLQGQMVAMRRYEFSPLAQVQQWSQVPRGLPLFESTFAFENFPLDAGLVQQGKELGITVTGTIHKTSLPLSVQAWPGEQITLQLAYDRRRFSDGMARQILAHLQTLLEGIALEPEKRLGQLSLLTRTERQLLLAQLDQAEPPYSYHACMHELFEAQAARTPEAVAVVFDEQQMTFDELNRRANQLAHYLRKRGVGPETLVGLLLERSADAVVAILGILKAGGAYVPLDPAYPGQRLAYIVEDARAALLLTRSELRDVVSVRAPIICIDQDWPTIAEESSENPAPLATPENLAYVLYTSGSTGQPKGVEIEHRQVANYTQALLLRLASLEVSSYAMVQPLTVDSSVSALYPPLLTGGSLHILTLEQATNPRQMADYFARHAIDLLKIAPSHLAALQTASDALALMPRRCLIVGGEASSWNWVRDLARQAPACAVFNHYGPTETTVGVLMQRVDPESELEVATTPIGRPIANTQAYVLDAERQPVPAGVVGELYIGGANVGRGYLRQPEMTEQRFVPDTFGPDPAARLYRTGDLVRSLPDGSLEFRGRADDQVKIRGFRVELGEIEAALQEHPDINEVAVLAREDRPGSTRLVAYLATRSDPEPTAAELRHFLQARLPDHMVPSAYIVLPALPHTPHGKLDRNALPAPDGDQSTPAASYAAPRTSTEETLASIWAEVLRVERVGIHDNFFELGGHSLIATQVISRVEREFGVELPLRSLFDGPTVEQLAGRVHATVQGSEPPRSTGIPVVSRAEPLPLSNAQERLWILNRLQRDNGAYNSPTGGRIRGPLDLSLLQQTLDAIVARHEVLRTTFPDVSGKPFQRIGPAVPVPLEVIDLRDLPDSAREREALRQAAEAAARPFDLATGPLLRAHVWRLADDDHVVLLAMHHIVVDAWSNGILVDEGSALYNALKAGQPASLPPLPVQYADFAAWQRSWLAAGAQTEQLAYWKRKLSGAPAALELPTDRPRPRVPSGNGERLIFTLPRELLEQIYQLSRDADSTLFMTLLAAFQVLLARYSGQYDVVVGSPIANRRRDELERLIGFFLNTLAYRTDLHGSPSFLEALQRVRETALEAYAHQDLPFEVLVEALRPERDLSRAPIFQVFFVLLNTPQPAIQTGDLTLELQPPEGHSAKFDMTFFLTESETGLTGMLEYSTDLFDRETMERFLAHYQLLLERVVADPEQPITAIPLLTDAERQQLVRDWNATARDYPLASTLAQRFEEQARRTPDATALIFDGQRMSYADLNARANHLAHRLANLGVAPGARVAVCLQRSFDLVVGLLAVLKAGAAYVPLDPAFPEQRLAFMLDDSQASALLTQSRLTERLPAFSGPVIRLDRDWPMISVSTPEADPLLSTDPDDVAALIYTSGSTGQPKGVLNSHRALLNTLYWQWEAYPYAPGEVCCQKTALSFGDSIQELFAPLLAGVPTLLVPDSALTNPAAFIRALTEQRVTRLLLVPSLLNALLGSGIDLSRELPDLRLWILSGEEAPVPLVQRLRRLRPDDRIVNLYGQSEAAYDATAYEVTALEPDAWTVPIGKPISNMQVYILDEQSQPVPLGVTGEICVAGTGLARGYWNRPELTGERFVRSPFGQAPEARIYRTGDFGRWRRDGNIEFLGRADDQVKIRGIRIELGEVEATLLQHPAVREAVVVAREDAPGEHRLVAYVTTAAGALMPSVNEWRAFLRQRLPEYMIPSAFVSLPLLKKTPSGKVDRRALPSPTMDRPELDQPFVEPATETERALANVWQEVLRLERIGVHDNFFDLGGASLQVLEVVAKANEGGLPLAPELIFVFPTIAELAEMVE